MGRTTTKKVLSVGVWRVENRPRSTVLVVEQMVRPIKCDSIRMGHIQRLCRASGAPTVRHKPAVRV